MPGHLSLGLIYTASKQRCTVVVFLLQSRRRSDLGGPLCKAPMHYNHGNWVAAQIDTAKTIRRHK